MFAHMFALTSLVGQRSGSHPRPDDHQQRLLRHHDTSTAASYLPLGIEYLWILGF